MIGSEKPPTSGAARSSLVRSARERAMKVAAALLLAAAFVLTGTPTATATPALIDNHTSSSFVPCRGEQPGFCPGPATVQSDEQAATDSNEQLTQDQLPES